MLVSLGNFGTRDWMQGYLSRIYGNRHDMISMLKSADAPGRSYVLYANDEVAPNYYNFNRAPTHVVGLRTEDTKLGVYSKWVPFHLFFRELMQLKLYGDWKRGDLTAVLGYGAEF